MRVNSIDCLVSKVSKNEEVVDFHFFHGTKSSEIVRSSE